MLTGSYVSGSAPQAPREVWAALPPGPSEWTILDSTGGSNIRGSIGGKGALTGGWGVFVKRHSLAVGDVVMLEYQLAARTVRIRQLDPSSAEAKAARAATNSKRQRDQEEAPQQQKKRGKAKGSKAGPSSVLQPRQLPAGAQAAAGSSNGRAKQAAAAAGQGNAQLASANPTGAAAAGGGAAADRWEREQEAHIGQVVIVVSGLLQASAAPAPKRLGAGAWC